MILSRRSRSPLALGPSCRTQQPAFLPSRLQADGARPASAARRRGPRSAGAGCRSRGPAGRSGCRGAPSSPGGSRRCAAATQLGEPRPSSLPPASIACERFRACSSLARGIRRRRSRRPARRGPSSSSRTRARTARSTSAQRLALQVREADHHVRDLHAGVVDVVLDARRRARGAAARARRCRRGCALRRWPMWAALFGLMLVCSTITCPGPAARPPGDRPASRTVAREGTPGRGTR